MIWKRDTLTHFSEKVHICRRPTDNSEKSYLCIVVKSIQVERNLFLLIKYFFGNNSCEENNIEAMCNVS